jgi:hypothetical protein
MFSNVFMSYIMFIGKRTKMKLIKRAEYVKMISHKVETEIFHRLKASNISILSK